MINAEISVDNIISLYESYGQEDYDGEPVSQASHMIQCAMLAMDDGADIELIAGAFLHDVGHLLRHHQHTYAMGNYGVVNHEGLGAAYLRQLGFSDRICEVVDKHVQAKRYLVAKDTSYRDKLSEASWETLKWQGGPMIKSEMQDFMQHPYFDDIIKVRMWDEQAKRRDAVLLPLNTFKNIIREHLKLSYNENRIGNF